MNSVGQDRSSRFGSAEKPRERGLCVGVAAGREVGEAVGLACQNIDYRLRRLKEQGKVVSKMVGNSLVWMLTNTQE